MTSYLVSAPLRLVCQLHISTSRSRVLYARLPPPHTRCTLRPHFRSSLQPWYATLCHCGWCVTHQGEDVSPIGIPPSPSLIAMSPPLSHHTAMSLPLPLIVMFLSLSLTVASPSPSLIAISPHMSPTVVPPRFVPPLVLVLSRWLVLLREAWHLSTYRLPGSPYIKILYTHCKTLFHLALPMDFTRQ